MNKHNCIICGKPSNDGIIINGIGICKNCEERLVNSNIETDFYSYFKECIRKSIVQSLLKGADTNCQNYHL